MADAKKAPVEDEKALEKAVEFAYGYSRQGAECPFCSREHQFREGAKPNPEAMKAHLKKMHPARCVITFQADDINADMRPEDPTVEELLQLSDVDEYDKYDMLYIDPKTRKEAEAKGDVLRWADPAKVAQWKNRGAEVLVNAEGQQISNTTGADGTARANEMVAIRLPNALVNRMRSSKAMRADQSASSKEDLNVQADKVEKAIYDRMVKEGQSTDVARQVSRARAGYIRRTSGNPSDGDWNGSYGDPRARSGSREWRDR